MFGFQVLDEAGEIESFGRLETSESERTSTLGSKEFEAVFCAPSCDHRVGLGMACLACDEAFFGDFAEDVLQSEDDRNRRRARRVIDRSIFREFDEVKIIAAVFDGFGAFHSRFRNCEKGHPWRQRKRLLHTGEHDVDVVRVHVDGDRRE